MTRTYLLLLTLLFAVPVLGQNIPDFKIINSPGQLKAADSQVKDSEGWTHFYNSADNVLLLSVHGGEANIGSIEKGLSVTSGLLGSYGNGGQDLSSADYIEDTHRWFVMNRYWRIDNAPQIDTTLRVRFYFNQKDIEDIRKVTAPLEEKIRRQEDLEFFTVSNISTHPFTENALRNGGKFTLHHPPGGAAPTCTFGRFKGWKYVELSVSSLKISGGGGKYIKPFDGRFRVTGFVKTRSLEPLEGVEILEKGKVVAKTDANGFYQVEGLVKNESYTFKPRLSAQADRGVTVLDMVYLQRGLKKTKLLQDPWLQIAADANYSDYLTASDLVKMRDAILHQDSTFAGNGAWRFVTQGYEFPSYGDPFKAGMPQSQSVSKIKEDRENLNFTAIKTGDLVRSADFPNKPPLDINPVFTLADEISCGTGDTVSVALTVDEFRRVMGFQFSIQWDDDILQFLGASDFQLSGLDANSFTMRYRNDGRLGLAWTTVSQRGTSVKDGTAICRLNFLVNGKNGESSRVEFKEYPTPIQILRDNFSSANTLLSRGSIKIDNQSPLMIIDQEFQNITCKGERDGSISFKIKGGSGKYGYKWNTGQRTPDLSGLSAGTYKVTVYDEENCPYVSEDFVVTEPRELRMAGSQVFPISCPGASDGRIEIRVIGGTEPYSFNWSHGADTRNIKSLSAGKYSLTISDAQGCTEYATFNIDNPGEVFVGLSLSNETANGRLDGAIRINKVIGGTPPYSYKWQDGSKENQRSALAAGDYAVTITDAEKCRNELSFGILRGEETQNFKVNLQNTPIEQGKPAYITIQSPIVQNVGVKLFDSRSKQVRNESLALLRGSNTHYFTTPREKGTYLLQILPSTGGVQSLRFAVK